MGTIKRLGKPGLLFSQLAVLTSLACGSAPPAQLPPQPPAQTPADAAPPVQSEAISRADALIEDFRRRQIAQDKYDREHPSVVVIPVPRPVRASQPETPSAPAPTESTAATATPATPAAAPGQDARWWRDRMQGLEQALRERESKLAAAANLKYGYNDAQAQYKKFEAEVADARAAIQKLRDEARRAGVPPSWLR